MRFGVFLIAVVGFILVSTSQTISLWGNAYADGSAADAMCNPVKMDCECGMVKNQQTGQCEKKGMQQNMHNCPCQDTTNGHVTSGKCTMPNHCQGEKTDGKAPEMPKIPEMPKPPEKKPSDQPQQQDPCSTSSGTKGSRDSSATSSDQCASSYGGFSTSAGSSTGSSYGYSGYSYDSGSSGSTNPFISLLDGLQNGQVGGSTNGAGAAFNSNLSDQSSITPGYGSESSANPYTVGQAVPIGGATGFSAPGGFGAEASGNGPSLIETIGDVMSAAGDVAGSVVTKVVDAVKSAVGIGGADSGTPTDSTGTASDAGAAQTEADNGPVEHVGGTDQNTDSSGTAGGTDKTAAGPDSNSPQSEGQNTVPSAAQDAPDGTPSANTPVSGAAGEQVTYEDGTQGSPQMGPNAVSPSVPTAVSGGSAQGGVPRTPSLPTSVVIKDGLPQDGFVFNVLSGFFGGVNLVVGGISNFFRGLFSVFVH